MDYNSQYFDDLDLAMEFVRVLCESAKIDELTGNDIHMYPDGFDGGWIVEWIQGSYDRDGSRFEYIGEDDTIVLNRKMPDGTWKQFESEEAYEKAIQDYWKTRGKLEWQKESIAKLIKDLKSTKTASTFSTTDSGVEEAIKKLQKSCYDECRNCLKKYNTCHECYKLKNKDTGYKFKDPEENNFEDEDADKIWW